MTEAPPIILSLAPTGMVPTRNDSPFVPLSPEEVARDVEDCAALGITYVHLHARDENGAPDWRPETFRRFVSAIRERTPEMVICVTTSGRNVVDPSQRGAVLELGGDEAPELASLTLSSLNFARQASLNAPSVIKELLAMMLDRGIHPELEVFDLGMANQVRHLIESRRLPVDPIVNVILGGPYTAQAHPLEIGSILRSMPETCRWGLGGIGRAQLSANAHGVFFNGGVRTGLEDNLWLDRERQSLASNVGLVTRVNALAEIAGRRTMTPGELRKILQENHRTGTVRGQDGG